MADPITNTHLLLCSPKHEHKRRGLAVISVIICMCIIALLASQSPDSVLLAESTLEGTTITIEPSSLTIQGCESIQVEVWVHDVENLYGADLRLSFDPSLLEVTEIVKGGFLVDPLWVVLSRFDNDAGTIEWAATQLNPTPPQTGSGVLATLRFRAKGAGISPLHFTFTKLAGIGGVTIPASATDSSVSTVRPNNPNLSIARVLPTTAQLTWTEAFVGATYHLYRDQEPYFTPGGTPYQTIASGLLYNDLGALGDTVTQHYYVVRSACANGFESENSNRVGEYDYALTNAGAANMNDIAVALVMPTVPDAKSLAAYIGSSVMYISHYDNVSQSFETYPVGLDSRNFALSVGEFVFVTTNNTAPSSVSLVGNVPEPGSVSFSLESGMPPKQNFASLPLDRGDLNTASSVASDIGTGVLYVSKYHIESQTFETFVPPATRDFSLVVGEPFVLTLSAGAPSAWPGNP